MPATMSQKAEVMPNAANGVAATASAAHVRLQHLTLERAKDLWEHIKSGQLWKVSL